jgi:uncharacterized protein YndB with AHSA1/START domain
VTARSADHTLVLTRELAAPRELVFDAWSKPEHLAKWFGPAGFTATVEMDFRPGGALAIRMTGNGHDHWVRGTYLEIVRPERIVQRLAFEDVPDHPMTQTIELADAGGRTRLTIRHELPPLAAMTAAQQALMRPRYNGSHEGWTSTLSNLEAYLARESADA